jgi:predicted nucleotide-binding protein (sugar kinase/HSP70/actin superfamily)
VFYRYFKGYRPHKIDNAHLERVLRKEIFEAKNGLLAQLVIYNWDEAQWQLYGALQKEVKKINEDVEAITAISDAEGDAIFDVLEAEFDKRDVYIGAVINGVRVSKDYLGKRFGAVA